MTNDRTEQNDKKPFALEFLEEIPATELDEVSGGAKVETLALSVSTHGKKDNTVYDQF